MIVDTSALVAVALAEEGFEPMEAALRRGPLVMSAGTWLEAAMVFASRVKLDNALDSMCANFEIELLPFTADHARLAFDAFGRYGKGTGAKAQLNFGDCISYSLAKSRHETLLFKGDDFTHTDVVPAIPPAP